MITIKKPNEFERMAVAGATVATVLRTMGVEAKAGVTTKDLDDLAAEIIADRGCKPSFLGYHGFPARICTSPNSVIVHGIPDDYALREGDVVSIDVGAIYEGFHGDAAITIAVGEVPREVSTLLEVTEEAMWAGIDEVRNRARVGDIGSAVEAVARRVGAGVVRDYVGHGIGRQMHEQPQVPNYGKKGTGMKLRAGMAICIEPMFALGSPETRVLEDEWTVVTADGSVAAHFEHTVALTDEGVKIFTELEPRTADLFATPEAG